MGCCATKRKIEYPIAILPETPKLVKPSINVENMPLIDTHLFDTPNFQIEVIDETKFPSSGFKTDDGTLSYIQPKESQNISVISELNSSVEIELEMIGKSEKGGNEAYFSISSNAITGKKQVEIPREEYKSFTNQVNLFEQKTFIFFYFEIGYFILFERDFLEYLYPELNLVMIIEINDTKMTQEKIFFVPEPEKEKEKVTKGHKFIPLRKKEDMKSSYSRTIMSLELKETDSPLKVSISLYTHSNKKLLVVCSDEIYMEPQTDGEMQKYKMYRNLYMKHNNKKMGNLFYHFAYKLNTTSCMNIEIEKEKSFSAFKKLENIATFNEIPQLNYTYNKIPNDKIVEVTNNNNEYFSVVEIDEFAISEELDTEPTLDRLLELIMIVKRKQDIYLVTKKINNHFSTKEFNIEKLILFKNLIYKRLEDFLKNKNGCDNITLPYIFSILKKAFFKPNIINGGVQKKNKHKKIPETKENFEFNKTKLELMVKYMELCFNFVDVDMVPDVSLSALSFLTKYFDNENPIHLNEKQVKEGTHQTYAEYFFNYIIKRNKYELLFSYVIKYHEYQACAQPTMELFARLVREYKHDCKSLITFICSEDFFFIIKRIIKIHDCNSVVITNLFVLLTAICERTDMDNLNAMISFVKIREIFNIFRKKGFEHIQEAGLQLIRILVYRKSETKKNDSIDILRKSSMQIDNMTEEEYIQIILIFNYTLIVLQEKIKSMNFMRLSRWILNVLTYLYTLCCVISNLSKINNKRLSNLVRDKQIPDLLAECLYSIYENKIFSSIDIAYDTLDPNLINIKILIYRTLLHSLIIIKWMKANFPTSISKKNCQRLLRIMTAIKTNPMLNPSKLIEAIDEHSKKNKNEETIKFYFKLYKSLKEYQLRYVDTAAELELS